MATADNWRNSNSGYDLEALILNDDNQSITKADLRQHLRDLEQDLKAFILEREISSTRWIIATFLGAQIAYFAITLTAVWFMISHLKSS